MSSPVVTVIVPGRDVAAFAGEAIASLREQTFADWRAILVDDGSTDDTATIFDEAAAADPRFRVVRHDRPLGLGAARNRGLDLVTTPLVGFLDADDRYTPRALEALVQTLTASGSDLVAGAYVRLRPDASGTYSRGVVQPWVKATTDPARVGTTLAAHPAASANIVAWSKVSRIELWRRHGLRFPEGKLYEDQLVAQLLFTRARAFDVIPDVVVEWRERADGSSITQRVGATAVLADYLEALQGGLAVLDAADQIAAARERVALILGMDVPPLIRLAAPHPDPEYRRMLGAFVRALVARAEREAVVVSDEHDELRAAAALW